MNIDENQNPMDNDGCSGLGFGVLSHDKIDNSNPNEVERAYKLELVTTKNQTPCPRFSFCAVGHDKYLYIWGGRSSREHFKVVSNTLARCDLTTNQWESIDSSETPESRTGATAIVHDDCIWIFGGYHSKYTNTTVKYDLKTRKWERVNAKNEPPPRRWHYSIVKYDDKLWMFGGTMDRTHFFDFHVFDFETKEWSEVEVNSSNTNAHEVPKYLQKLGHKLVSQPRARRRHTAVVFEDAMWVIGGREETQLPQDILRFDFKLKIWTKVESVSPKSGCKMPAAADHSTWIDEKNKRMFIFGAKDINIVIYEFHTNCMIPVSARNWNSSGLHQMTTHHGNVVHYNNALYIFGGQNKEKEITNSLLKFSLTSQPQYKLRMNKLLNSKLMSDVVFEVEGEQIYAHRVILFCHSEYFKSMFSHQWKESSMKKLTIPIDDCSKEVFLEILRYFYTDELWTPNNVQQALEMLKVVDIYGVEVLRHHCVKFLEHNVNKTNALMLLRAAEKYSLETLRELCTDYVCGNFRAFLQQLRLPENSKLMPSILDKVANKLDPVRLSESKKLKREAPLS